MKMIINNEIIKFDHEDFPMLISGAPGEGSSFFSIKIMVDLFKHGEKVLLFSAYDQAKELFKEEVGNLINEKILIIESGNDDLFIKQLEEISDISERIILFKNIDNYDRKLFEVLKDNKLVIFSGDLNRCIFKDELLKKEFKTKIFFSYPEDLVPKNKLDLPKYSAHIISDKYDGVISVSK